MVLAGKRLDALKEKGVEPDLSILVDAKSEEEPVEPEPLAESEPEPLAMLEPDIQEVKPGAAAAVETEISKTSEPVSTPQETIMAASKLAPTGEQVASLTGNFRVQLASYRKPISAHKGWKILANKYIDLLGSLNYALAEVNLGAEKGIYHRLEAGPLGSLAEAQIICAKIQSRKDSCITVKP